MDVSAFVDSWTNAINANPSGLAGALVSTTKATIDAQLRFVLPFLAALSPRLSPRPSSRRSPRGMREAVEELLLQALGTEPTDRSARGLLFGAMRDLQLCLLDMYISLDHQLSASRCLC